MRRCPMARSLRGRRPMQASATFSNGLVGAACGGADRGRDKDFHFLPFCLVPNTPRMSGGREVQARLGFVDILHAGYTLRIQRNF